MQPRQLRLHSFVCSRSHQRYELNNPFVVFVSVRKEVLLVARSNKTTKALTTISSSNSVSSGAANNSFLTLPSLERNSQQRLIPTKSERQQW